MSGCDQNAAPPITRLTPVESLSSLDEVVEASDDLLHRSSRIMTVSKDDVDVVHLKAGKRLVQSLDQVLAGESTLVGILAAGSEEDLHESQKRRRREDTITRQCR